MDYATERWLKLAGTRTCQYGELRGETIALGLQALHRFLSKSKLFRRVKKCSPPPWNVDTLGYSALCPLKEPRAVVRGCASESRLKVHQRCDLIRLVARLLCSCFFPRGEPPAFHVGGKNPEFQGFIIFPFPFQGRNGGNWSQNYLWCPNDRRG